jgi:cytochrome c553
VPKHIARLIVLMVCFAAAAYAAKVFFTAHSFYAYGHYRGDSVAEIASDKPKYKGSEYCKSCHAELYAEWFNGVHHSVKVGKVVQCEVCHQAAGGRDIGGMFQHVSTGADHPASGELRVPADTLKLCPLCHEKMPGRPAEQPQIDVAAHAGTQQCTTCHNPHSPMLMRGPAAPAAQSGGAPGAKTATCAGCHGADGVSSNPVWPNLAGQHGDYLVEALKAYKTGKRQNAMMAATAKGLSDTDIHDVAGHYAALKIRSALSGGSAQDIAAGKAKAAACAGCHGAEGISGNPAWPSLAGQQKPYLVAALKAYRDGSRKNDMMAGMAGGLSDADIDAIALYYSSAPAN